MYWEAHESTGTPLYSSVYQTVVRGYFGRKSLVKIVSDTKRMKNTPIQLPLLRNLQQKVGESVPSITDRSTLIILENI
jgi:hypothetical protein